MEILMTVSRIASICTMGANASALEKEIGPEQFPVNEHYFGLVNLNFALNKCLEFESSAVHTFSNIICLFFIFFVSRGFSNTETLCSEYKYYCEECRSKQEAHKRMKVKKLPMILALHLKRFKYMDQLHRYTKLSYRVVFPLELRLFNTSGDATNPDRMYDLVAVVVHCGSGPNRGHYIAIVKSHDFWLLFDDDIVEKIDAQAIEEFYGLTSDISKNSESGYILFYQSRD
ncbi:ubiquitin carboxyl-terminal hydrolase 12 [Bombina bombina]|uniref:ubiquitin carboxyl-terminal hydrolase 12 n=1 Tax=Bombina bombina TaxID=8345 RepID=UPI00235B27AE|nr:ubiquitin carboxyl-terminal hydrolase 12 [Bombina bombina]